MRSASAEKSRLQPTRPVPNLRPMTQRQTQHPQHPLPPPHHPPRAQHHPPPPPASHYYYEFYNGMPRHHARRWILPYEDPMEAGHIYPTTRRILRHLSCHEWFRFFRVFSAKLVLEVIGAGGAIWGFSDVLTLRTTETQELWRRIALMVGLVFLVRYYVHAREFLREMSTSAALPDGLEERLVQGARSTIADDDEDDVVPFDPSEGIESLSLISNDDDHVPAGLVTVV